MTNSSTVDMTFTLEGVPADRIAEVQAEATRVLDEHAIVNDVYGSGSMIGFKVTFGNYPEAQRLSKAAHNAALHIAPCDFTLSTR